MASKRHRVEDDNEDIAYLNLSLIHVFLVNYSIFFGFTLLAIGIPVPEERNPFEKFEPKRLFYQYGKEHAFCYNTDAHIPSEYISIFRRAVLYVWNNVSFRLACCLSMPYRMAINLIIFHDLQLNLRPENLSYRILNLLALLLSTVDVMALTLVAIIHIILDMPKAYEVAFTTWIITAAAAIALNGLLGTFRTIENHCDRIIFYLKAISTIFFLWQAPFLYNFHAAFMRFPSCHSFVSFDAAFAEYAVLGAYFTSELIKVYEMKDNRMMMYPRTSSGECCPLEPKNFEGGKFSGIDNDSC
ncbi:unnamed protein product [Bursaphelenchus xylophilus]|uniref:(pine wood nematode) hypothetical protein n=1 Tax=Bursaphelenchus xylophilus TaxID=6326 RepID=A0A1I7RIN7_BURXY|nr:unnamed protein product [Bursaphelenchus xylophilus]CAG9118958.1 unnamed protein product [Bursaphelenchus xylophilus]